jgi:hypothetical protein
MSLARVARRNRPRHGHQRNLHHLGLMSHASQHLVGSRPRSRRHRFRSACPQCKDSRLGRSEVAQRPVLPQGRPRHAQHVLRRSTVRHIPQPLTQWRRHLRPDCWLLPVEYMASLDPMSFEENALEDYMVSTSGVVHTRPDCRLLSVECMACLGPISFEENALEDYMVPNSDVVHTTQGEHPLWKPEVIEQHAREHMLQGTVRSGVCLSCADRRATLAPASHRISLLDPQIFVAEVEVIHTSNIPADDSEHCWDESDETDDAGRVGDRQHPGQQPGQTAMSPDHSRPSIDASDLCTRTVSYATERTP